MLSESFAEARVTKARMKTHCISCKTRVTGSHHLKGFQILTIVTAVMEKTKVIP